VDREEHELEHVHLNRSAVAGRLALAESHAVPIQIKRQSDAFEAYQRALQEPKRQRVPKADPAELKRRAVEQEERERARQARRTQAPPAQESRRQRVHLDKDSESWTAERLTDLSAQYELLRSRARVELRLSDEEWNAWLEQDAIILSSSIALTRGLHDGKLNRAKYMERIEQAGRRIQSILTRSEYTEEPETEDEWMERVSQHIVGNLELRKRWDSFVNADRNAENEADADACEAELQALTRKYHPESVGAPHQETDAEGNKWVLVGEEELRERLLVINRASYRPINLTNLSETQFQLKTRGQQIPLTDAEGNPVEQLISDREVGELFNELRRLLIDELPTETLEAATRRWARIYEIKSKIPQGHFLLNEAFTKNPSIHPRWRFHQNRVLVQGVGQRLETEIMMRVSVKQEDSLDELYEVLNRANQTLSDGLPLEQKASFIQSTQKMFKKAVDKAGGRNLATGTLIAATVIGCMMKAGANSGDGKDAVQHFTSLPPTLLGQLPTLDDGSVVPPAQRVTAAERRLEAAVVDAETVDRLVVAIDSITDEDRARHRAEALLAQGIANDVEIAMHKAQNEAAPFLAGDAIPGVEPPDLMPQLRIGLEGRDMRAPPAEDSNPFPLPICSNQIPMAVLMQNEMAHEDLLQNTVGQCFPAASPQQVHAISADLTVSFTAAFKATAAGWNPLIRLMESGTDPAIVNDQARNLLRGSLGLQMPLFASQLSMRLGKPDVKVPQALFNAGLEAGLVELRRQVAQTKIATSTEMQQISHTANRLPLARMYRTAHPAVDSSKRYPEQNKTYLDRIAKGDSPFQARWYATIEASYTSTVYSGLASVQAQLARLEQANPTAAAYFRQHRAQVAHLAGLGMQLAMSSHSLYLALTAVSSTGLAPVIIPALSFTLGMSQLIQLVREYRYQFQVFGASAESQEYLQYQPLLTRAAINSLKAKLVSVQREIDSLKSRAGLTGAAWAGNQVVLRSKQFKKHTLLVALYGPSYTLIAPVFHGLGLLRKLNLSILVASLTVSAAEFTLSSLFNLSITGIISTVAESLPLQSFIPRAVMETVSTGLLFTAIVVPCMAVSWFLPSLKDSSVWTAPLGVLGSTAWLPYEVIRGIWTKGSAVDKALSWYYLTMQVADQTSIGYAFATGGKWGIDVRTPSQVLSEAFFWSCTEAPLPDSTDGLRRPGDAFYQRGLMQFYVQADGINSSPFDYLLKRFWRLDVKESRGLLPSYLHDYAAGKWGEYTDVDIADSYKASVAMGEVLGLHRKALESRRDAGDADEKAAIDERSDLPLYELSARQYRDHLARRAPMTRNTPDDALHPESFRDSVSAWTSNRELVNNDVDRARVEILSHLPNGEFNRNDATQFTTVYRSLGIKQIDPAQARPPELLDVDVLMPPVARRLAVLEPPTMVLPEPARPPIGGNFQGKSHRRRARFQMEN
jgi:hypothetical protein